MGSRDPARGHGTDREARLRKPRRWWVLPAAAAAASAVAWVAWSLGAARATVRRAPGANVLLITVDTLRADALGAYGRSGAGTPWIDRLAGEGVRFERAHAHNVVTLPSHANLLSGRYPLAHGVRDNSGFRFPADAPTLATLLKARGYRTAAFVSSFALDSRFGLDVGFDVYDDRLGGAETRTAFLMPERPGTETVASAVRWLVAQGDARVFCFVHLYEPHFPYRPPEAFARRFPGEPYQGEVAAADAALEPLLRPILEADGGRTLVVLTADHGEALGDHGEETHGIFAYEATLRVPLILYAPRSVRPALVRTPVRHVDVLPTVLDLLGLETPADLSGRSLLPLIEGRSPPPDPSYFEALSSSLNQGWAPLRGVVDGGLKYVDLPLPELYDLAADPAETRNLAASRSADLERLRGVLAGLRTSERAVHAAAEEASTLERLRALGYVTAAEPVRARERYTDEDDPKRLIEVDRRASEVLRLYEAGDLEGALALSRENIQQRPNMPLAYLHEAYLLRERGDLEGAVQAARKAVALRPADQESVALLGVYLEQAGRPREAVDLLEPYAAAAQPDLDVLTARGMGLAALDRREEALATFARARAADPSNAMVLVNVGTVHLLAGELEPARAAFESALKIDAGLGRAYNSLGVIAARQGRTDEAVERWKVAARLDPRDYQTLFNLGSVLRQQGRAAEARPYLESYLREAPVALEGADIRKVRGWLKEPAGEVAHP